MNIESKINWAILVTGWGRNAKDTIEAFGEKKLRKSNISLVVYESEPCGAAEMAKDLGVETLKLLRSDFENLVS